MIRKDWKFVLSKGILAPSADNLQPWKFQLGADSANLFLDPDLCQSFCDTGNLMPYASAGAVIENIRVACAHLSKELFVHYFPNLEDDNFVARLNVATKSKLESKYFSVLDKRCTNRRFYDAKKLISDEIYERIKQSSAGFDGFQLRIIKRDDSRYCELSKLVGESDQMRFENERLHRELVQILRFSKKEIETTRDGLDINSLETGPGGGTVFKLISSWARLSFLNKLGLSSLFNSYAKRQMSSSQAVCLITSSKRNLVDFVRGGELMQRVWHECQLNELAVQPMEALPIMILNEQLGDMSGFSMKELNRLRALKESMFKVFNIDDGAGLLFLFRMGYAEAPTARSLRRPVESFYAN